MTLSVICDSNCRISPTHVNMTATCELFRKRKKFEMIETLIFIDFGLFVLITGRRHDLFVA